MYPSSLSHLRGAKHIHYDCLVSFCLLLPLLRQASFGAAPAREETTTYTYCIELALGSIQISNFYSNTAITSAWLQLTALACTRIDSEFPHMCHHQNHSKDMLAQNKSIADGCVGPAPHDWCKQVYVPFYNFQSRSSLWIPFLEKIISNCLQLRYLEFFLFDD